MDTSEVDARLSMLLLERGLVTAEQLHDAETAASRTGAKLGSVLLATSLLDRQHLYALLSEIIGLPTVDLEQIRPDSALYADLDPERLLREGWVPVRRTENGGVLIATDHHLREAEHSDIAALLGVRQEDLSFAITTTWDLTTAVLAVMSTEVQDLAVTRLWRRTTALSAKQVLSSGQKMAAVAALVLFIAAAVLWPGPTVYIVIVLLSLGYLVGILFKFVTCYIGSKFERTGGIGAEEVAAVDDADLPVYTILVPVYHEAEVIADLVGNLARLDYPPEKLEVLVLMESDDEETWGALVAANPPPFVKVVVLPDAQPKTKPKACNVGLIAATGEFLVIYDAEDRPDPDQLKKAVIAFRGSDEKVACLQAALNYWNVRDNALTRMFTLEYSFWFDYMLPGLSAMRLPIPLGGTSNHFRTAAVRELGGWDPYNVTEDADLGIRASMHGWRVGIVDSTTFEEANRAYGNFIRQRSRWIKGYIQTVLVHSRRPVRLVKEAGPRSVAGFALLIGGTPLTFLAMPPLYLVLALYLLGSSMDWLPQLPDWLVAVGVTNLILGNGISVYIAMVGAFKRRNYSLVLWALLNPIYWMLHSVAAYKALWQLITRPHYWEKTRHGLSERDTADDDQGLGERRPTLA